MVRLASTTTKFSDPYLCIISTSRNSNYIRLLPLYHVCRLLKHTQHFTQYTEACLWTFLHTKFHMYCSSDNNYCCHINSYYRSCTATIILYLQKITTNSAIFSKTYYHTKIWVFYISRPHSVSMWDARMASMLTLFMYGLHADTIHMFLTK
jgi:hypothetical protein